MLWSFQLPEEGGAQLKVAGSVPIDWHATAEPDAVGFLHVRATDARSTFIRSDVYCFSPRGKLSWKYTPGTRLAFPDREFKGPWRFRSWHVLSGSRLRLAASFIDDTWWPSFVVALGPDGLAEPLFVNAGHVEGVSRVSVRDRAYVLAGGVNNKYRSAALAVIDEQGPAARSPQSGGSPFVCENCPNGEPRKYFVFPQSDINIAASAPHSYAEPGSSRGTADNVEVSVREVMEGAPRAIYRFSPELVPESVAMSDRDWQIHRQLSQAGKLDHTPEDCPARIAGVIVRLWEPDRGWKNIHVPPTFAARTSSESQ